MREPKWSPSPIVLEQQKISLEGTLGRIQETFFVLLVVVLDDEHNGIRPIVGRRGDSVKGNRRHPQTLYPDYHVMCAAINRPPEYSGYASK
jgi:hypothetical protein